MNLMVIVSALVAAVVTMFGWYIVHYFSLRREIAAEKRKTRVSFLLEAYRRLENAGNRKVYLDIKLTRDIESALADIQLLGTVKQVQLACTFTEEFVKNGTASFNLLLYSLRETLRKELDLEFVEQPLNILRITYDN